MVIVEAMACGLAVVSFDCPWGPSSIIKNGEDGMLVENERVDLLAKAMTSLINNPDKCRMLAKNATHNVQRFQMDQIAERWKRLFESLI